jgi:hypothetical protein
LGLFAEPLKRRLSSVLALSCIVTTYEGCIGISTTMLKSLLITCLLAFTTLTASYAQTLKVTKVDASVTKLYDSAAKIFLGKPMVLAIYDNSATVKLADGDPIIVKLTNDNEYSAIESESDKERHTFYLTINKTLGVITSSTLKYLISEKGGQHRTAYWLLTAKRF